MKPASDMGWLSPALIVGAFIVGAIVAYLSLTPSARVLCADGNEDCLREWVGALSGWAALVAALLTVGVMREQLVEQRRQTDFIYGDARPEIFMSPSIYLEDGKWHPSVKISVINRNRRPLYLEKIEFSSTKMEIGVKTVTARDYNFEETESKNRILREIDHTLSGRLDGIPDDYCEIECRVYREWHPRPLVAGPGEWKGQDITIRVHALLKDAIDQKIVLETHGVALY